MRNHTRLFLCIVGITCILLGCLLISAIRMDKEMVSLSPEQMEYYEWLQNEVNNGHQPWRIVPEQVVSDFLINHLNIEAGPKPLAKKVLRNGLEFTLSNEENHLSIFPISTCDKGGFRNMDGRLLCRSYNWRNAFCGLEPGYTHKRFIVVSWERYVYFKAICGVGKEFFLWKCSLSSS